MRIFFVALFVILGANLMIELLDSNMMEVMQKRNETIQKSMRNCDGYRTVHYITSR